MICISFSLSKYIFSFKVNGFLQEEIFLITAQCYNQEPVIQKSLFSTERYKELQLISRIIKLKKQLELSVVLCVSKASSPMRLL